MGRVLCSRTGGAMGRNGKKWKGLELEERVAIWGKKDEGKEQKTANIRNKSTLGKHSKGRSSKKKDLDLFETTQSPGRYGGHYRMRG